MKKLMAGLAIFLGFSTVSYGQATPAGGSSAPSYNPGPSLPLIDGSLQYALTASEIVQLGLSGNSGVTSTTNLSGDVEYVSPSTNHPFSMLYTGGVLLSTLAGAGTSVFQTFTISQGLVAHGWAVGVSDSVAYMPESPTTGLSGIPGVGDLGLQPTPDPSVPAQTVLTNYGKRVVNTLSGNIERQLSGRTSVTGSGSYGILRFVGDNSGLDSTQINGQAGINHQLNRRSTISASAQYSTYFYTSNASSFNTRGLNFQYSRQMSRTVTLDVSAGPEWTSGFEAEPVGTLGFRALPGRLNELVTARPEATTAGVLVPSSLIVMASATLNYTRKTTSAFVGFNRGVNNGSGVQTGALANTVSGSIQRTYGRTWAISATGAYTQTTGLVDGNVTTSVYGGTQLTRRLSKTLSGFVSYTGIHQSVNNTLASQNAFNGFTQSFSIGITFSPRLARLGQF